MTGEIDVSGRVTDVLADAEEPLSTGAIQRSIARDGLDVATSAIREACRELVEAGEIEDVGEGSRTRYRLVE